MNPNKWRNNRQRFNNFGGWNPNLDSQWFPEPGYHEDMDEGFFDNGPGWQYNGRGGGPPRSEWGGFNPGPGNWGPPVNFGRGPPNICAWGRGFGPAGPPIQNPRRNSDPIAYLRPRAHYTSKTHFKKQSKRSADTRKLKHQLKNEAPLKSRNLYCELCDVQITSKPHAESHYGGKIHRAVVEGRKKPKNSALLSPKMAARVEQLIRREKKALKLAPGVEKTEEEVAQAKALQPELYCEICKTSVTCTEQMTMHLNGKRHLAKEKQHILKVMTTDGEDDDKEGEDVTEGAEEETVDDAAESVAKNPDEVDDKYDWGNGSGAWEEDEKQEEK